MNEADNSLCPATGKRRMTRKNALASARFWALRRFARMRHYRCRHCGAWHVGNDNRKHAAKGTRR